MTEVELFEQTISWLRDNYNKYTFFVERDIVWTIQTQMWKSIREMHLPCRVFNEYPMIAGKRQVDLAIVDLKDQVEVAVEFKYEPSRARTGKDIDPKKTKFPVTEWNRGVAEDIAKIHQYVVDEQACFAYSIFVDEGGYFKKYKPHAGSVWLDWGNNIWILYSKAPVEPQNKVESQRNAPNACKAPLWNALG